MWAGGSSPRASSPRSPRGSWSPSRFSPTSSMRAGMGCWGWRGSWRWIGVVGSLAATVVAVVAIWEHLHSGSGMFAVVVSVAAVVAHANLCLFVPLTPPQKWVRTVTILAAFATAALIDAMVLGEDYRYDFPLGQNLAAAAGIIASCGTLVLLVL